MPGFVRIKATVDVADLSRDLRAFGDDLDQPIRDALEYGARAVATAAKPLMRFRADGAWASSSGAKYGHIQDYYAAKVSTISAAVYSNHPAAPVWEWGGTIHPLLGARLHHILSRSVHREQARLRLAAADKDRPPWTFHIPRLRPVGRAADEKRPDIARHLEDAVDALIKKYDLG